MSNVVEQSTGGTLTDAGAFRLRMERQCRQIRLYRLAVLRDRGRLLSQDEAAMEWIDRYAATFDRVAAAKEELSIGMGGPELRQIAEENSADSSRAPPAVSSP